jgi:hypothetical protein
MRKNTMSIFSKRHYEAVALALQAIHPGSDDTTIDYDARLEMWKDTRDELAQTFCRDNSRFQAERFRAACEPNANVKLRTRYTVVV